MRLPRTDPLDDAAGYGLAALVTLVATGLNALMAPYVAHTNLVMVYLLGVTFVASRCSPRPAVLASLLCVAAFDFFFVHPSGTFAVADVQYVFTFGVMLVVSLLISTLTVRLREQAKARGDAALHARLEQTRGDLLSAVSHDLRTPLASIQGSADALGRQPGLSEQGRQLASTIQEESSRMARLVQNLLDMTRVQGAIELDLDWYGLDELIANAIERTQGLLQKPIQMKLPVEPPIVRVDGVLIEQVFVNLLENAARHAGATCQIVIRADRRPGMVRVVVHDDGPGFSSEMAPHLFERFHGSKGKGSGLGLAICRAAVEAHGGKISAASGPEGASFVIDLPVPEEQAGA